MPEYRFGDRIRQRLGFLEKAQYRQDHKEECEIVDGENARGDDIATRRLACPEIAEPDHGSKEDKQKLPVQRPIIGRTNSRSIEPRHESQHDNRCCKRSYTQEFVGDATQDGVERKVIPFRHNSIWCLLWICWNEIVGRE